MPELDKDEYIEKLEHLLATAMIEWVEDWELLDKVKENVKTRES